ncbi:MAG: endolytic transglycosylase MltG [Steroidobacteraceae bacterium]
MRSGRLALVAVLVVAVLVALGAGAAGGALWVRRAFNAPGPARAAMRVEIEPGLTLREVLGHLAAAGALAHPRLTELYLRLERKHLNVKAGEYEIPARASAAAVVELLAEGKGILDQLTIIEGTRFSDFRRALETDPNVRATLAGETDAQVMAAIGHPGEQPEGRFFPDTYRFAAGTPEVEILKLSYDKMSRVLAAAWAQRLPDLPLTSAYQALILASMIEKETGLAAERPLIAGVFVSRLRKGMRLQSDPTVIYGMGSQYDGDIRTRDLEADTAYNTYTRPGLPPTPISLPGRASILAAVRPEVTGALYFVATGNGDGSHHFSATLQEHDLAVRHYLARLRVEGLLPSQHVERGRR